MAYNIYNILINGVYWRYIPPINLLLTSSDIQVDPPMGIVEWTPVWLADGVFFMSSKWRQEFGCFQK